MLVFDFERIAVDLGNSVLAVGSDAQLAETECFGADSAKGWTLEL